jgi:WhiB family transcriptional regulator, redox-sensing transcriptional regulator
VGPAERIGAVTAPASLGRRQAAVLEHLQAHPGLTAGELSRAFGLRASLYKQLADLEQRALVVGIQVWNPGQGRQVTHWHLAPPGTVPPPRPAPDPAELSRRRERDSAAQRARRARRNPARRPALPSAPASLADAACKGADTDLFFGPDAEFVSARQQREAEAKAICARCPVRDACLAYALDTREAYGIWGGLNEDERRTILRRRRAS